jgi:hypothetical protein
MGLAGKLLQSLPRAVLFGKRHIQMSRIHAETAGWPPLGKSVLFYLSQVRYSFAPRSFNKHPAHLCSPH